VRVGARHIAAPRIIVSSAILGLAAHTAAGRAETFDPLRDRGPGISTSMFGIYVRPGELLIYPYYEHYRDQNYEYKPAELGYGLDQDFRGRYRASEGLVFVGYGVSDRLALELEAAVISARLERAAGDASGVPRVIEESGIGDIESQLRWRWAHESGRRPEIFSYFETVLPTQESGSLIGTTDWEFVFGTGFIRGLPSGTMTARAAAEYARAEGALELGEVSIEYLRRLSPAWRVFSALEGTQDEWELIAEAQWHVSDRVIIKLNNAFGVTSKAPDWAPEVGVMFSFPER
jgi:hypothetical protein